MKIVDDSIFFNPDRDSILGVEREFYDYLATHRNILDPSCCCAPKYVEPTYNVVGFEGRVYKKNEVPKVDIYQWADKHHLKVSDDRMTLTCYKAVEKTKDGKYVSLHDDQFQYAIGEYSSCEKFDRDQLDECSYGLHGTNLKGAYDYYKYNPVIVKNIAYLELKVDISDPDNYVVPYTKGYQSTYEALGARWLLKPADKIRFKKCFVTREVQFKLVAKDLNTGEEFDW